MAQTKQRKRRRISIGAADLQPGEKRIISVDGKQIGLFNVAGTYHALNNHCPHMGGNLCQGPVTGTSLTSDPERFVYGREGEMIRCSWHGWEFEIATGRCLVDDRLRVRLYEVTVENEELILHI